MNKVIFKVEDIISHKSSGTQYRIKEFTLETAILKNILLSLGWDFWN